ncbi:MAG: glycosyltransferase family 39 protein, partial [Candidatus Obscuribacterales bacterium]|nr:glycosyltransferase family 39 protein [Candidatus Obscuribacterales bacterium]
AGLAFSRDGLSSPGLAESDVRGNANRYFFCGLGIVLVLSTFLYLAEALCQSTFTIAESCSAIAAVEMLRSGDFLTPTYYGKPFYHIPGLSYWAMLPCLKIFGHSLLAVRLPSILAALALITLSALIAKALAGARAGILSALVLATSREFSRYAALCMCDMLFSLFCCLGLTFSFMAYAETRKRSLPLSLSLAPGSFSEEVSASRSSSKEAVFVCLAACSLALAVLTKGPIGLLLPSLSLFIFLCCYRSFKLLQGKNIALSGAVFTAISLPWFFSNFQVQSMSYIDSMFLHENLQRFIGTTKSIGVIPYNQMLAFQHPPYYMLKGFFVLFAPWTVILPIVIFSLVRLMRAQNETARLKQAITFGICWIFTVVAFFTAADSNWSYYVLPTMPAAAVLTAVCASRWKLDSEVLKVAVKIIAWLVVSSAFFVPIALPILFKGQLSPALFFGFSGALATLGCLLFWAARRGSLFAVLCTTGLLTWLITIYSGGQIVPTEQALKSPLPLMCETIQKTGEGLAVKVHSSLGMDYNLRDLLTFRTQKASELCDDNACRELAGRGGFLLIPRSYWQQLGVKDKRCFIISSGQYAYQDLYEAIKIKSLPQWKREDLLLVKLNR